MTLVWTIWTAWGLFSLPGPLLSCRCLRAHISPLLPPTSPHLTRHRGHPCMRQFMLSTGSLVYLISPPVVVPSLAFFWPFLPPGSSLNMPNQSHGDPGYLRSTISIPSVLHAFSCICYPCGSFTHSTHFSELSFLPEDHRVSFPSLTLDLSQPSHPQPLLLSTSNTW